MVFTFVRAMRGYRKQFYKDWLGRRNLEIKKILNIDAELTIIKDQFPWLIMWHNIPQIYIEVMQGGSLRIYTTKVMIM